MNNPYTWRHFGAWLHAPAAVASWPPWWLAHGVSAEERAAAKALAILFQRSQFCDMQPSNKGDDQQ